MHDSQNRNPPRCKADDNVSVNKQRKPFSVCGWQITCNILFLLVQVMFLGGIVWHYSRFSSHGESVLLTEVVGTFSNDDEIIESQRLMVRNRFPFVLMVTVWLCRIEGDATTPHFTVLKSQYSSFTGVRSWYSGTFETRVNFVASDNGQFTVTDQPGTPQKLLKSSVSDDDLPERDDWNDVTGLPPTLVDWLTKKLRKGPLPRISEIREDRKSSGKDIIWNCFLPGDSTDKVLVITMTPCVNYGR